MSYGWRVIEGVSIELCNECGFDARSTGDVSVGLESAWSNLSALLDHRDVDRRPQPNTWSAREYVAHCVEIVRENLEWVAETGISPPDIAAYDPGSARQACADVVSGLQESDWRRVIVVGDRFAYDVDVEWTLKHTLHDLVHHVLDIRNGYASIALGATDGFTIRPQQRIL